MLTISRRLWLVDQVTTNLADVNHGRAIVLRALFPEIRRGKLLTQDHRSSGDECNAKDNQTAVAVIYRQTVVNYIVFSEAYTVDVCNSNPEESIVFYNSRSKSNN
jgi:hypothetical protein